MFLIAPKEVNIMPLKIYVDCLNILYFLYLLFLSYTDQQLEVSAFPLSATTELRNAKFSKNLIGISEKMKYQTVSWETLT